MKYGIRSRKAWVLLGVLGLAGLGVIGEARAVSFILEDDAIMSGDSTATTQLTNRATSFCYLSRTSYQDLDTSAETGTCRVVRGPVAWVVEATLGNGSDDADVHCNAICYTTT